MLTKNWMPSVAGFVSTAGTIGVSLILFAMLSGETFPKWVVIVAMFAQAGGLSALGITAKQYNTTGGTVGQPSTPEALDAANQAHSVANPPVQERVPHP